MVIDITGYGTYSETVAGGVFTESGSDILQPLEPELGNASGGKRRDLRSWCSDDVLAIALSRRFLFGKKTAFLLAQHSKAVPNPSPIPTQGGRHETDTDHRRF
jgi:hypothetical protein